MVIVAIVCTRIGHPDHVTEARHNGITTLGITAAFDNGHVHAWRIGSLHSHARHSLLSSLSPFNVARSTHVYTHNTLRLLIEMVTGI